MISIIIPVFNNLIFTKQCLLDLNINNSHEIIVIDNGSTDETKKFLNNINNIKTITNKINMGYAFASNQGFKESSGDVILFLNNDIRINKEYTCQNCFTNEIEKVLQKDLSSNNTLYSPTAGYIDKVFNFKYETNSNNKKWNYLSGWCLFGNKDIFKKFIDVDYDGTKMFGPYTNFGTYFEDTFLSFKAKHIGVNLKLIDLPLQHIGKQTSSKMNLSKMYFSAKTKFIHHMKKNNYEIL